MSACRKCHLITTTNLCPECKLTDVSSDWTGVAIILDPEKSQIAKTLSKRKSGSYALRVR